MITEGKYKARATGEVVVGESKEKHTPFVELYFEITQGENAGGKVRWTGYFTETKDKRGKTGSERVLESLYACGWEGVDLADFEDNALHGLDANEVEIVVELEEYEKDGETRTSPRVRWVNRPGSGGAVNVENAMAKPKLQSFSDRMKGLALALKQKQQPGTSFDFGANEPKAAAGGRRSF